MPRLAEGNGTLAGATAHGYRRDAVRHRRPRSAGPTGDTPHSTGAPCPPSSLAPRDINIVLLTAQIKHCPRPPSRDDAFELKVTFCVRGVISPLLANVFLHYVLDLWVHQWRKRYTHGRIVIVRYADDFVMGFQYESDARKMMVALRERLATFGLMLHEEKTRLLEFGRLSTEQREARGDRRPETFAFLGFTHYCARSRDGRFVVKRRTDRKRLTRKLHTVRTEQRRRMHTPLPEQHRWLCSVLRGHYRYYGLPSNWHALDGFYDEVCRGWFRALRRRSQRGLTWNRFNQWLERFPLPRAGIFHTREALA